MERRFEVHSLEDEGRLNKEELSKLENSFKSESIYIENEEFLKSKVKYLFDNYDHENTLGVYWRTFKNYILTPEIDLGKNIYEFTSNEVEQMMLSIPAPRNVKNTIYRLANLYIDWALKIEKLAMRTNPFDPFTADDLLIVNKKVIQNEYMSMDDVFDMAIISDKEGVPYQKIIVFILGRLGLYGKEGSYLADLRKTHINRETNTISIVDDMTGEILSQIPVTDERVYYWLECAENETQYDYRPYITENNVARRGAELVFIESDGRVLKSYNKKYDRVLKGNLYNALKEIFRINDRKLMGFKKLVRCAKFDQLDKRLKDNGKLTVTDVQEVQRMYEPTSTYSSYYTLKQDYESYNPNIKIEK